MGTEGVKQQGSDANLRPCFDGPIFNDLTQQIAAMAQAHRDSSALCYGDYTSLVLTNRQIIFQRRCDTERVIVAVNADSQPYVAHFDAQSGQGKDLITGQLL